MNTTQLKQIEKIKSTLFLTALMYLGFVSGASAQNNLPGFGTGDQSGSENITTFFNQITTVILIVCGFVAIIIVVLAFKGLAGQGDWRTFWNKIAGGIGIFVVPAIIRYLITKGG